MKIFTAEQLREWDEHTVLLYYNNSAELMERAASAVVEHLGYTEVNKNITLLCGIGNNGGDGLCIARMLAEKEYEVEVYIVGDSQRGSPDFKVNMRRLLESEVPVRFIHNEDDTFELRPRTLLMDCLIGTGVRKQAEGLMARIIARINEMETFKIISIDLPSGLMPDDMQHQKGSIIKADKTITFETPKRAMLSMENSKYVGEFVALSLGLSEVFHDETLSSYTFYDMLEATQHFRPRRRNTEKTDLGHVHVIAGSEGKVGAAVLSTKAAMRAGCGLATVTLPSSGVHVVHIALPEAMCIADQGEVYLKSAVFSDKFQSTVVGPGIGRAPETVLMLRKLLKDATHPLVLDADALNIIAEKKLITEIPKQSILTPHRREFERLFGKQESDEHCLQTMSELSREHNLYILLKGANTRVATPDGHIYFIASGNPGMATAGSGDALSGVIGALLAQGYSPEQAACLGVFAHGFAGDMMRAQLGESGMIARDIIEALPQAFRTIGSAKADPYFF